MKSQEDFANFAKTTLYQTLQSLDNQRAKIANKILLIPILILSSICLGIAGAALLHPALFFIFLFGSIVICLIIYFLVAPEYAGYKKNYKEKVINQIVKFVDNSLSYNPAAGISKSEYLQSSIYLTQPDRYSTEDLISGKIGDTEIKFAEIHSEYKTETTDSKGHKQTQWHTIFKGIFVIADFHKDFKGRTVVLPDFAEKFFGFLGKTLQSINFSRDQLVKLEDPDFEKLFVVYSTDQIEARYILSPSLMQKMVELNKKLKLISNQTLSFSFINSKLFIAIQSNKNFFEPPLFSTTTNLKTLTDYFSVVNLCAGVVEDLNLNTRIWTKT